MNKVMKELLKDIIIAMAIVIALSFIIKPTIVKQESMTNTLHNNDYLILNKLAYLGSNEPAYKDIIVFESNMIQDNKNKLLIKRVIGTEGDVINIHSGKVYRNGILLNEPYIKDGETNGEMEVKVSPNHVFAMGDNRLNSIDSRDDSVGVISEKRIVGKATLCIFPFSRIGLI